MKRALLMVMLSCMPLLAADYYWVGATTGVWTAATNWNGSAQGYPNAPDDSAMFTNYITAAYSVNVNAAVTAGTLRFAHGAPGTQQLSLQMGGGPGRLMLQGTGGVARVLVQPGGNAAATLGSSLTVELLQDAVFEVQTELRVYADLAGTGTIHCSGPGKVQFGMNADCPAFSGTLRVAADNRLELFNQRLLLTNTNVTLAVHGMLSLRGASGDYAAVYGHLQLEDGALLDSSGLSTPFEPPNRVQGDCVIAGTVWITNSTVQLRNLDFLGAVCGTGIMVKTGLYQGFFTNRFLGPISPGFNIGTLTMVEQHGTIEIGAPGAPAALQIELGAAACDVLHLQEMDTPLDLTYITVSFAAAGAVPEKTNWFLACDAGFINDFAQVQGDAVELVRGEVAIGAVVVPEGAGACAALLPLLLMRRMT